MTRYNKIKIKSQDEFKRDRVAESRFRSSLPLESTFSQESKGSSYLLSLLGKFFNLLAGKSPLLRSHFVKIHQRLSHGIRMAQDSERLPNLSR